MQDADLINISEVPSPLGPTNAIPQLYCAKEVLKSSVPAFVYTSIKIAALGVPKFGSVSIVTVALSASVDHNLLRTTQLFILISQLMLIEQRNLRELHLTMSS